LRSLDLKFPFFFDQLETNGKAEAKAIASTLFSKNSIYTSRRLQRIPPSATIATHGGDGDWCKPDGGVLLQAPVIGAARDSAEAVKQRRRSRGSCRWAYR
jgi:hypothetical protein